MAKTVVVPCYCDNDPAEFTKKAAKRLASEKKALYKELPCNAKDAATLTQELESKKCQVVSFSGCAGNCAKNTLSAIGVNVCKAVLVRPYLNELRAKNERIVGLKALRETDDLLYKKIEEDLRPLFEKR